MSVPSSEFQNLPRSIVVFICSFDYFKKGLPYYTVKRVVKELGIEFEDESTIIYINGEYKGEDPIGKLIHDLNSANPEDMYNEVLRNRVKYFKEQERGIQTMCKVWDDIRKSGKAEGLVEGEIKSNLNSIQKMMKKFNISLEEALETLEIENSQKELYKNLINNKF